MQRLCFEKHDGFDFLNWDRLDNSTLKHFSFNSALENRKEMTHQNLWMDKVLGTGDDACDHLVKTLLSLVKVPERRWCISFYSFS